MSSWALSMSPEYRAEFSRVPRKYQNQISRKTQDLMHDPTPGGSRTPLAHYHGLCRLRAGDYRVIYAHDDRLVQLLSLRKRDERTYDNLDQLELQQFAPFQTSKNGQNAASNLPSWEAIAGNWHPPKETASKPLARLIDSDLLRELNVPEEYHDALRQMRTEEELLACETVPEDICEQIVDAVYPPRLELLQGDPLPVVMMDDLISKEAAEVNGPIDTNESTEIAIVRNQVPKPLIIVPTRQLQPMRPYAGNTARAIGKESAYTVKLDRTIQLTYSVNRSERALLTTDGHNELVRLVNEAKRNGGAAQDGGPFFINEFRHVLVPTQNGLLFAGVYTRDLEFWMGDTVVSPVAPSGIRPGNVWPGPHVGIKYTLAAGASDIRYDRETPHGTRERVQLSTFHSAQNLRDLLSMFRRIKPNGGAIYVNEARECFAPVEGQDGYERVYIGHLGNKPWFPEPD